MTKIRKLDAAGVKHDAAGGSEGRARQVLAKGGADDTVVAVSATDLTPDDAKLGVTLLGLALVDVGNLLSLVEVGLLLGVHA